MYARMYARALGKLATAAAVAATIAAAAPGALRAQASLEPVRVTARRTLEAEELERRALARYGAPRQWREAAYLYERAAAARGPADSRGLEDLRLAGYIYHGVGDLGRARALIERAADLAAARGDVVTAANTYVEAGLVAIEARRDDLAGKLAMKAELMANSPLLDIVQRATIMNRVGYSQLLGMAK